MNNRAKQRGFVLAMTLIIIALITIVTFMAVNVSTMESKTAMQDYNGARAMYASRAGLSKAMAELWPGNPTWGESSTQTGTLEDGTTWAVDVDPIRSGTTIVSWKITSTGFYGTAPQQAQRQIVAYAERETFARYAYFTDRERSSTGSIIRFVSNDAITGPVHTNGYFTIAGNPRFSETVVSANLGIAGVDDGNGDGYEDCYRPGPPAEYRNGSFTSSNVVDFYRPESGGNYNNCRPMALNGSPQFSFAGGQAEIPLPTAGDEIRDNADKTLQLTPPPSPGANHYQRSTNQNLQYTMTYDETTGRVDNAGFRRVNSNGSTTSVSASDAPPVFKLTFNANGTARVTRWDAGTNSFRNWNPDTQAFQSGAYDLNTEANTFNAKGFLLVEGRVDGRVTLGSDYDIHITNNLTYENLGEDVLGMVAKSDIIVESRTNGSDRMTNGTTPGREIHASMMALNGSFTVDKYDQGSPRGQLRIRGGIIQRTRGAVGTGSASQVSTGYAKDYQYDETLQNRPPLNFPTTGKMVIRAVLDKGAPGSIE